MRLKRGSGAGAAAAFVIRCSASCALAYALAAEIGLDKPVWTAVSAAVVSQESLSDTRSSLTHRIAGTVVGAAISLAVGELARPLALSAGWEIALAVAIAAFAAHRFPGLRVAMWTCPVILLTATASEPLWLVAWRRAVEVIFGAAVAFALHGLINALLRARDR